MVDRSGRSWWQQNSTPQQVLVVLAAAFGALGLLSAEHFLQALEGPLAKAEQASAAGSPTGRPASCVRSAIRLPRLPGRPRIEGSVWAVTTVRDEADIIGHTVRHLLRQGVDGVIVLDHRSTDGTSAVLAELTSEEGTVVVRLRAIDGPQVIGAFCHDLHPVAADGVDLDDPAAPLVADERPDTLKVAIRPPGWVWADTGNHTALDLGRSVPGGLRILHAQYRRPQQLRAKAATGAASVRRTRGLRPGSAHHWMQIVDGGEREAREAWERQLRTAADGHPLTVGDLGGSWPRALTRTDHGRD